MDVVVVVADFYTNWATLQRRNVLRIPLSISDSGNLLEQVSSIHRLFLTDTDFFIKSDVGSLLALPRLSTDWPYCHWSLLGVISRVEKTWHGKRDSIAAEVYVLITNFEKQPERQTYLQSDTLLASSCETHISELFLLINCSPWHSWVKRLYSVKFRRYSDDFLSFICISRLFYGYLKQNFFKFYLEGLKTRRAIQWA